MRSIRKYRRPCFGPSRDQFALFQAQVAVPVPALVKTLGRRAYRGEVLAVALVGRFSRAPGVRKIDCHRQSLEDQNLHQGRCAIRAGCHAAIWRGRNLRRCSTSRACAMPNASRSPCEALRRQAAASLPSSASSICPSCGAACSSGTSQCRRAVDSEKRPMATARALTPHLSEF